MAASKAKSTKVGSGLEKPTEEMWNELRIQYEGGSYSFQDLANLARARGYAVSKATVGRRCHDETWVRGSVREEIRQRVIDEHIETVGKRVSQMLENHATLARTLMAEASIHLMNAQDKRKSGMKDYVIPAALLSSITNTIERATIMEARAMGFNYKEGRPFTPDEGDDAQTADDATEKMKIEVMTQREVDEMQRRQERVLAGEAEDVDE